MQDGKRKSIVTDAKILMFLRNEGWNGVNSQQFTAALTAVLQSLQEHWRAEAVPAWAGREEPAVGWLSWALQRALTPCRVKWVLCSACPCVSVGMAPSIACCLWKNPGREGILCSWVGAGECPCSFCCPALSPYSHVPPCALCQICAPGRGLSSCLATEKPSVSWARGAPALQWVQLLEGVGMAEKGLHREIGQGFLMLRLSSLPSGSALPAAPSQQVCCHYCARKVCWWQKRADCPLIFAGSLAGLALSLLWCHEGIWHLGPSLQKCSVFTWCSDFQNFFLDGSLQMGFMWMWIPIRMGRFGFPSSFLGCCCHLGCEPAEPQCWPRAATLSHYHTGHGLTTLPHGLITLSTALLHCPTALSHCPWPYHTVPRLLCWLCSWRVHGSQPRAEPHLGLNMDPLSYSTEKAV